MKDEGKEWVEELEKMKKINFFPYLITDPDKENAETIERKREIVPAVIVATGASFLIMEG